MDVREILHWLVDAVAKPEYEQASAVSAADVHAAIDQAHGYKEPEPALTAEESAQLEALQAKQRAADEAKAAAAAGAAPAAADTAQDE